jgi:hypothetical protein
MAQAMSPWAKWPLWAFYVFFAAVLLLDAENDWRAMILGGSMVVVPLLWLVAGKDRTSKLLTALFTQGLNLVVNLIEWGFKLGIAVVTVAVPLAAFYFLVRFIKWAWYH